MREHASGRLLAAAGVGGQVRGSKLLKVGLCAGCSSGGRAGEEVSW